MSKKTLRSSGWKATAASVIAVAVSIVAASTPASAVGSPPTVSGITIDGVAATKGAITVQYDFADADGDSEGATSITWQRGSSATGPWTTIPGVVTNNLVLPKSYGGDYVRPVITPVDVTGTSGVSTAGAAVKVEDRPGNPAVDWFYEGKFGLSHHFLSNYVNRVAADASEQWGATESWDDFLSTFDVNQYANDVAKTGASFVILTLGQNSGWMLGPNKTYEQIAGIQPGVRTPANRDLPMEIADALAAKGVKLMLYLPANPPHSASLQPNDFAITKAFKYTPQQDGKPSQETMKLWQSVIRDYSERYGDKVAGWWFDGVFPAQQPAYQDTSLPYNYHSLFAAAKAGNPNSIVTINSGLGSPVGAPLSEYQDYTPGEANSIGAMPPSGRWANEATGVQWFNFTFLGADDPGWAGWGNKGTSKNTVSLVNWVNDATDAGGVVGLDTKVNRFGRLDPSQLSQLEQVNAVVKLGAPAPQPPYYNNSSSRIVYSGTWGTDSGRTGNLEGDVKYTNQVGASASFTFTGTGVDFISERFVDTGKADVYLDGVLMKTIDLLGTRPKEAPYVAYSIDGLARGEHTIKIVHQQAGSYLLVDAFVVRDQVTPVIDVTPKVATKCVAGKVMVTASVRNDEAVPLSVQISSSYGVKSIAGVTPGAYGAHAFTTRKATIPAGTVTFSVAATIDGVAVTRDVSAGYPSATCQ